MRSRPATRPTISAIIVLLSLALFASACEEALSQIDATRPEATTPDETAPPETSPPETQPPATEPPSEGTSEEFNWVALILVLLGVAVLLAIIGAISSARQKSTEKVAAEQGDWRSRARGTYGKAKWLYEGHTPELAGQIGDAQFARDELETELTSSQQAVLDRWTQLGRSVQETTSELYALEANPPVPEWSQTVQAVTRGVGVQHQAFEAAIVGQVAYRKAEGNPEVETSVALKTKLDLDAEVRLASSQLAQALAGLSSVV